MKKILIGAIAFGVMLCSCSESDGSQNEPNVPGEEESKAYIDVEPLEALQSWAPTAAEMQGLGALEGFAYNLNEAIIGNYDKLWPQDKTGNYSVSPVSISVFLSALSQCVDGQAREDLCKMLGLDEADATALNNKLLRYLSSDMESMQVSIANSVWHVEGMPMTEDFKSRMALQFGAPVNILDLYSDESVKVLNGWCGDKTHGMINDIFKEAPAMDFILANALYFSGSWMNTFAVEKTSKWDFSGTAGSSKVDMMHNPGLIAEYANLNGTEYMSMPFGFGYEMSFIVPASGSDMDEFGKSLDSAKIDELIAAGKGVELDFRLPRFKDNHQADIMEILLSLGYPAYDMPTLEMTGLSSYPLRANGSKVLHATALNVNEKGAEMAAVTIGEWDTWPGDVPEFEHVEMTIDRPFYYILRNTNCDAVLMIGRVCNL